MKGITDYFPNIFWGGGGGFSSNGGLGGGGGGAFGLGDINSFNPGQNGISGDIGTGGAGGLSTGGGGGAGYTTGGAGGSGIVIVAIDKSSFVNTTMYGLITISNTINNPSRINFSIDKPYTSTIYSGGKYYVSGASGSPMLTSSDLISWYTISGPVSNINKLASGQMGYYSYQSIYMPDMSDVSLSSSIVGKYRNFNAIAGNYADFTSINIYGPKSGNYNIIQAYTLSGNITKIALADIKLNKIYDKTKQVGVMASNLINTDTINYPLEYNDYNVGDNKEKFYESFFIETLFN
jgi:hypothetical protein